MPLKFDMVGATHVGTARSNNEDSLKILPYVNLAALADGMGGHNAGEVASMMAVNVLSNAFEERLAIAKPGEEPKISTLVTEAFTLANTEIYTNSRQVAHYEGMGTTLVAAAFREEAIYVGYVGDSRLYQFSKGALSQLTVDHTLAMDMLKKDPDATVPVNAHHILKRAMGMEGKCRADFFDLKPEQNQIYLLCSDGLTGVVDDKDIAATLALHFNDPEHCIEMLIQTALDNHAQDNVSVILVFVR